MNFLIRGLDLLEYFLGCKLSHRQNFPFCVFCYHKVWTKIAYNFQISAYDYMKNGLTAHTGVYMAIHDRQRIPMMHEEAILLSLNTDTYIAISKMKNKRLELPYKSNCT